MNSHAADDVVGGRLADPILRNALLAGAALGVLTVLSVAGKQARKVILKATTSHDGLG